MVPCFVKHPARTGKSTACEHLSVEGPGEGCPAPFPAVIGRLPCSPLRSLVPAVPHLEQRQVSGLRHALGSSCSAVRPATETAQGHARNRCLFAHHSVFLSTRELQRSQEGDILLSLCFSDSSLAFFFHFFCVYLIPLALRSSPLPSVEQTSHVFERQM
ncbi:hypothetical protein AAFF_G00283850 [Aldrovandia affinis]|uniref:Uncharacterized protein n=1 Tax=Aldrovandia affinis TaxID=143900 RepID=A0AAD7TAG8_9TELE|nr:hypothetical protein AAFF_G00283850 [Aldrovandia affinis]